MKGSALQLMEFLDTSKFHSTYNLVGVHQVWWKICIEVHHTQWPKSVTWKAQSVPNNSVTLPLMSLVTSLWDVTVAQIDLY